MTDAGEAAAAHTMCGSRPRPETAKSWCRPIRSGSSSRRMLMLQDGWVSASTAGSTGMNSPIGYRLVAPKRLLTAVSKRGWRQPLIEVTRDACRVRSDQHYQSVGPHRGSSDDWIDSPPPPPPLHRFSRRSGRLNQGNIFRMKWACGSLPRMVLAVAVAGRTQEAPPAVGMSKPVAEHLSYLDQPLQYPGCSCPPARGIDMKLTLAVANASTTAGVL